MATYFLKTRQKLAWGIVIVILVTVPGVFLSGTAIFGDYEQRVLDLFFYIQWRVMPEEEKTEKAPEVVLVLIDEQALDVDYGFYSPTPHGYMAALIDSLAAKEAKAIVLDYVFFKPNSPIDPGGDERLTDAMRRAGNVIAASVIYPQKDSLVYREPLPVFQEVLAGSGYANFQIKDNTKGMFNVRGVMPQTTLADKRTVLSLSASAYCVWRGISPEQFSTDLNELRWAYLKPVYQHEGVMLINFCGPPARYEKLENNRWIQKDEGKITTFRSSVFTGPGRFPAQLIRDKVIFIGNGTEFARDQFVTPYYRDDLNFPLMRGAEIHANAFLNLVQGNALRRLNPDWLAFIIIFLSAIMVAATFRWGFLSEIVVLVGLLGLIVIGSYVAFDRLNFWLPVLSLCLSVFLAYTCTSIYLAVTEERQRKQIRTMFQRYAPPAYVDQLIQDPSKLELGGEEKEISMIFSDIEGFTTLSESIAPRKLVSFLNDYLNVMTRPIFDQGGTLDKYIGDAIVAVFGAPLPQENHAVMACYAALAMQATLKLQQERWEKDNLPPIRTRIGINTGQVVFGNIGSDIRYDYTGIGDAVNLAARLEGANKQYGTFTMLSEFTYQQAQDFIKVRELDVLIVKGKQQPVKVYELLGRSDEELGENIENFLFIYREGLQYYRQRHWAMALKKFQKALVIRPNDQPSRVYCQRCEHYAEHPPPDDWDGLYRLTEK